MGKIIGNVAFVFFIIYVIGSIGLSSVGISTPEDPLEVEPANWRAQILVIDTLYDEPVEAQLDLRHLSGPEVDIMVLDKESFDLWQKEGEWLKGVGAGKPKILGRIVMNDDFGPVNEEFKIKKFSGRKTTDWIPVGTQSQLYLVITNIDQDRPARLEAVLTVRKD